MRHRVGHGCVVIYIDLYGYACKNHDVWIGIDGLPSAGRYEKKPSEALSDNQPVSLSKEKAQRQDP